MFRILDNLNFRTQWYDCNLLFQTAPTPEESGHCDHVYVDEVGDTPVIVFRQGLFVLFF